jgi:hypothetical protein
MLRLGVLAGLVLTGLGSTGCSTTGNSNTATDAAAGGILGAGAGALIGAATHNPLAGAAIGGLVGAGTGAAIGSSQDHQEQRQATATAIAQAQAQAQARLIVPEQVVQMTKNGMDENLIINQIRNSGCTFIDPPNLTYLQQSGVSPRVIAVMQDVGARGTGPVVVGAGGPPPATVYVAPAPVYYGGYYGGYYRRW